LYTFPIQDYIFFPIATEDTNCCLWKPNFNNIWRFQYNMWK